MGDELEDHVAPCRVAHDDNIAWVSARGEKVIECHAELSQLCGELGIGEQTLGDTKQSGSAA